MQKAISFLRKYKYFILGAAIIFAVVLRVWDFSDAMLLKSDQIRDAVMAGRSLENGVGELPLLGPRAGGTKLRLGPAFYYMQSASAFLFDSLQPAVLALPNLLFSLLAIPAFFLLARLYFSRDGSLVLTTLFAFCFLAFEYSRFTWNPNSVPFFVLMFLYAWLKIFSGVKKQNWKWFVVLGAAFGIASQLHFTSMVALGIFSFTFLAFRYKSFWPQVGWWNLAVLVFTILFFYIPVILSDILNKGDNLNLFFKSIGNKTSDHNLLENAGREAYYFGQYYFRIAFGYLGHWKVWHYVGSLFLTGGIALNALLLSREKEKAKKDFLFAILIWTGVFLLLYFPLAYEIDKPRFFLPLIFLPYVHLGFLWQFGFKQKKIKQIFVLILATVMLGGNLTGSLLWLGEFARAQHGGLDAKNTVILKAKKDASWWTWGMVERATAIMLEKCKGGAIYFYLPKKSVEFEDVFIWSSKLRGEEREFGFVKKIDLTKKGCYFAVTKQSYDLESNLRGDFLKVGNAGDIAIYKLQRAQADEQAEVKKAKELPAPEEFMGTNHQRAYWKDVFGKF